MKTSAGLILGTLLLASCDIYESRFECPPGKGVGCASVGEVLQMIVEKEQGEDLFVKDLGCALILREEEARERQHLKAKNREKRQAMQLVQTETGELALESEMKSNEDTQ